MAVRLNSRQRHGMQCIAMPCSLVLGSEYHTVCTPSLRGFLLVSHIDRRMERNVVMVASITKQ